MLTLVLLLALGAVGVLAVARADDDDDGGTSGDPGPVEQATGDSCVASLPAELQLADCGYAVSPGDFDDFGSVGFVLENVSSQPVTNVLFDITARTASGAEASGSFLLGYLAPGERSAGGYAVLGPAHDDIEAVTISSTEGPSTPSPLNSDYLPLGTLSVTDVEIVPGPGNEARVTYLVTSAMDRRVQASVHAILRNGDGAIIGYAADIPGEIEPGGTIAGDVSTRVPNVAAADVYARPSSGMAPPPG